MTKTLTTKVLNASTMGVADAADILAGGGLVAFPTETVYGLGADACNSDAVARIFQAKGRPSFNPLIVHVHSIEQAQEIGDFNGKALRMAKAFWPAALTLVVPLRDSANVSPLVTAGLETVAIRMPDSEVALDLIKAFGGPIAAPSANPSGLISPTKATHVRSGLSGKIEAILDGGAAPIGLESTILGFFDHPRLLRPGGFPAELLEMFLDATLDAAPVGGNPLAPGALSSHYAPRGTMRLEVLEAAPGETMLGFGAIKGDLTLSESGDLLEAAASLFERLHELNAMNATKIAVAPVPQIGLGAAINDRLRRAAAPRR